MPQYNPVVSLTPLGCLLNTLLRAAFFLVHLVMGRAWKKPLRNFEENPATYSRKELVYFGYKYYAYPHLQGETPDLEAHFRTQPFRLKAQTIAEPRCYMNVGGDLMPYKVLMEADTSFLWEEAKGFFDADVVFANLETPIDASKPASWVPEVMLNNMYFNGNEALWQLFTHAGKGRYDVLSVANNHMLDQGYSGLEATLQFLGNKGVTAVGARMDPLFRPESNLMRRAGITFGFSAWTYSLNTCTPDQEKPWCTNLLPLNVAEADLSPLYAEAGALRSAGAEVLVISLHGGNAYQAFPQQHVMHNYRMIMEKTGAELIIGTHPHNPQPWEFYRYQNPDGPGMKTGLIIYSPGDFIAYDIFKWCHLPSTYRVGFSRTEQGVRITSFEPRFWYLGLFGGKELRLHDALLAQAQVTWRGWPKKNQREFMELMRFQQHTFPAQNRIFETP